MKPRIIAAFVLASGIPLASTAQEEILHQTSDKGFYLRFAAGYGFREAGTTMLGFWGIDGSETSNNNADTYNQNKVSFGQGPCLRLAGGYNLNKNVALELGFHGVIAPTYTYTSHDNFSDGEVRSKASGPYYVIPAIVLSTGSRSKIYGRAGLGFPLTQKIKQDITQNNNGGGGNTRIEGTIETELSFKPAFEGSLGVSHPLNNNVSIQAEVNLFGRTAYAKRAEITAFTVDGQNELVDMTTSEKVTEYDTEVTYVNNPPDYEPSKELTFPIGFNSIGLNIGIIYTFR